MVELGEVCEINPKKSDLKGLDDDLDVSFIPMSDMKQGTADLDIRQIKKLREVLKGYTYFKNADVLLAKITPCFENGKSGIARGLKNGIGFGSTEFIVIRPDRNRILPELIYHFIFDSKFLTEGKLNMTGSAGQQRLSLDFVKMYPIPLPPIEVQEKIVAELDGYQKIIDGAKQIVENYKPTIKIDPDWPLVELGEVCSMEYGYTAKAQKSGDTRFIRITDIDDNACLISDNPMFIDLSEKSKPYLLEKGDVLIARTGATYGKTVLFSDNGQAAFASYLIRLSFNHDKVVPAFFTSFSLGEIYWQQARELVSGGGQPQFNANVIKRICMPIPPLKTQKKIVEEIEFECELVEMNKKLIEIFEKKIKDKIGEVWGE